MVSKKPTVYGCYQANSISNALDPGHPCTLKTPGPPLLRSRLDPIPRESSICGALAKFGAGVCYNNHCCRYQSFPLVKQVFLGEENLFPTGVYCRSYVASLCRKVWE